MLEAMYIIFALFGISVLVAAFCSGFWDKDGFVEVKELAAGLAVYCAMAAALLGLVWLGIIVFGG